MSKSTTTYTVEVNGVLFSRKSKREYTHAVVGDSGVYSWHGSRKDAEKSLRDWQVFYGNTIAASKGLPLTGKGYHNKDVDKAEIEIVALRIVEI